MPAEHTDKQLEYSIMVDAHRDHAFKLFTESFGDWWPPAYSWAGDLLQNIGIEPAKGGVCFEIGPHGFHCDWGTVLEWEPPQRLSILWQISPQRIPVPDPNKASEVTIKFIDINSSTTRVELAHRHFERHGEGSADYCKAMASQQGWPYILTLYTSYLDSSNSELI